MTNVIPLVPPVVPEPVSVEQQLRDLMASLTTSVEKLDEGLRLMIDIIAQHDKRIRALELSIRKLERKNVPAIVNKNGERVN